MIVDLESSCTISQGLTEYLWNSRTYCIVRIVLSPCTCTKFEGIISVVLLSALERAHLN